MFCSIDERNLKSVKSVLPEDMATGCQGFDESAAKSFDSIRSDRDVNNVHKNDSSEEGEATDESDEAFVLNLNINARVMQMGRGNVMNFDSVDAPLTSENPEQEKSCDHDGPVLKVLCKPPDGRLKVGRSRSGFPDCREDHFVQIMVCKNQHTTEALDITDGYEIKVIVSCDGAGESSLKMPDYQLERLENETESHTNGLMIGVVSYMFRFHEPNTKYKISFSLHTVPSKRRGKKKRSKSHIVSETISEISLTLETRDIVSSRFSKTGRKVKARIQRVPPSRELGAAPLSEECTKLCKRSSWVMHELQSLRDNAKWEDFNKYASDLLLQFPDADTRIAIKLEQSVAACYQNELERAVQKIDEALSMISHAKNPQLLFGRGYGYKAGVMRRQRHLGEADRLVQLAEQNNHACRTHLDTIFIVYERASVLLDFIGVTSQRSARQMNEALSNLERCIDVCLRLEMEDGDLYVKKHHFAFIKIAMLLLDCRTEAARERVVSEEYITKGQECLNTLKTKYWSAIAEGVKVQFNLASSDLEYRRGNYVEAEKYASLARDMAVELGFNTEISHAEERLYHMRAITCGDTMLAGQWRFPASHASDSEGRYGDVSSSSGYESDCLQEIGILE